MLFRARLGRRLGWPLALPPLSRTTSTPSIKPSCSSCLPRLSRPLARLAAGITAAFSYYKHFPQASLHAHGVCCLLRPSRLPARLADGIATTFSCSKHSSNQAFALLICAAAVSADGSARLATGMATVFSCCKHSSKQASDSWCSLRPSRPPAWLAAGIAATFSRHKHYFEQAFALLVFAAAV